MLAFALTGLGWVVAVALMIAGVSGAKFNIMAGEGQIRSTVTALVGFVLAAIIYWWEVRHPGVGFGYFVHRLVV